ncbi:MAG: hypothetical protein WAX29_03930 [Propionibacterium sp.]
MPGIATFITIAGVAVAAGLLAGKIDPTARNPLLALFGCLHLLIKPVEGTCGGRAMKIRADHLARGTAHIIEPLTGDLPAYERDLPATDTRDTEPEDAAPGDDEWLLAPVASPRWVDDNEWPDEADGLENDTDTSDDGSKPDAISQSRQSGLEAFLAGARKGQ